MKIKVVNLIPERKKQLLRNQLIRVGERTDNGRLMNKDDIKIILYSILKTTSMNSFEKIPLIKRFSHVLSAVRMIEELTPREFTQIFPITKEYKGHRRGFKDYFTVKKYIDSVGWDRKIDNGYEFLMNFLSEDLTEFSAGAFLTVEEARNGGK